MINTTDVLLFFARVIVTILALSLLSGCVVVPRGGYYHPWGYGWHRGWRR